MEENKPSNPKDVIGRVCKHAVYTVNRYDDKEDLLTVKVTNIHRDGTRTNKLHLLENYKRDFYIVKPKYRKFTQKKDYIDRRMVDKYQSTQAKLPQNITKILYGMPDKKAVLKKVKDNVNLFGCESTTPVIIKHKFFEKYGKFQDIEQYTMAAYDVETNMFSKDEEVIMASVTFKERAYFAAVRSWYDEKTDEEILAKLKEAEDRCLKDILEKRNCTVEYELFDNEADVVRNVIAKWHLWEPDWIASWNASYDMEKSEAALVKYGYDPADVYSDPAIPKKYRSYLYHPGRTHKIKDNGDSQPLEPQERYPTLRVPAKWLWVDEMSFFAIKRVAAGKRDSYKLQFTAESLEVPGKLYGTSETYLPHDTPDWHKWMQLNDKYGYSMYNINDNFVIEDINIATDDLSLSLPMLLKSSEYFNYPSQPKCISDELSFIAEELGFVWGTTSSAREDEFDKHKPTLSDWIALLETEKNADVGQLVFEGLNVRSKGRRETDDIDVTGAYPTATVALNVSNRTTRIEACQIEGLTPLEFREVGVNLSSSRVSNAIMLGKVLHRFPDLHEIMDVWRTKINVDETSIEIDK